MRKLSLWHQNLAKLLTRFYYKRIDVQGTKSAKPTLFLASHRNGATDGQIYVWALDETPSLISIQMLRKWFLRLLFDGIPVVRPKDVARYGISPQAVASPIQQAITQIAQGGSLCLMPEGSSEWQHQALPYKTGMAQIVQQLKQQQIDFEVQCLGLFYSRPDGFKSRVSIVFGTAFYPQSNDIEQIQQELSTALKEVSVHCQSIAHFNQTQALAWQHCQSQDSDYGQAFLAAQQQTLLDPPASLIQPHVWLHQRLIQLFFIVAFFPTVVVARLAQKASDGRNNVTFFRLLGGFYGSLFTLLYWAILCYFTPILAIFIIIVGHLAWYYYPEPTPINLSADLGR
ncbi:1-acyl-sn-glycerol-3-phosphate acyltransferase [Acinetobacter larvae]|uniref:1-acyl-sn-glycerol-3-phosphate acyltransferase n=1 Tax=Acinetobacter larvae TaxID=1789224 RepID=UPI0012FDE0DB|nr:1-acyl-sn-glycerol-3-phosphate acyltransferase [Acinetobacter larvae]